MTAGDLLREFDPQDGQLKSNRDKTIEFLRRDPAPFTRSNPKGHLTASAVVVEPKSRRSLMVFHPFFKRWQQPGGHAEGDIDLVRVALREAIEETGVEHLRILPKVIDIGVGGGEGAIPHMHYDIRFLVIAPSIAYDAKSPEGLELRWFAPDYDGEELDDARRRMLSTAGKLLAAIEDDGATRGL